MIRIISDVKSYVRSGISEFLQLRQVPFFLFIAGMIAIPTSAIPFGGFGQWYRFLIYAVIAGIFEIDLMQAIIGKHEPIQNNKKSVALAILWVILFSVVAQSVFSLVAHLISPGLASFLPTRSFYQHSEYYIASFVAIIITVMFWTPTLFYPIFVLKQNKNPLWASFHAVRPKYFSLCLIFFTLIYSEAILVHFGRLIIEEELHGARDIITYGEYKFLWVLMYIEASAIWAAIYASIWSSAFLQITGVYQKDDPRLKS
jgi:hypothetical protein